MLTKNCELNFDRSLNAPNIWLVVGVNGAGKTTTIGKLSAQQRKLGRTVLMAAGDTFRAAAGDQLETWAQRSGAEESLPIVVVLPAPLTPTTSQIFGAFRDRSKFNSRAAFESCAVISVCNAARNSFG
ncbi:MAG: hypothetical protein EB050_07395 [Actinobacteria bacterium]|nr:hypothetical protein [Actinomycetota bacterium]